MIIEVDAWAGFEHLGAAERWQVIEDYRFAAPGSAIGRRRAVQDVLEHLCQRVHAACWVPGFDAQAWAMLHHDGPATCRGELAAPESERGGGLLCDLAALSIAARWWPIFDHGEPDPFTLGRVASLAQAAAYYSLPTGCRWCARHRGAATASAATTSAAGAGPRAMWQVSAQRRARSGRGVVVIDVREPASRASGGAGITR